MTTDAPTLPAVELETAAPAEPDRLPVLPLRGLVAFPGLALPLQVGREMSVTAVHEALARDGRILLLTQRDADCLDPTADDLFEMGTVAQVHQVFRGEGGTHKVIIESGDRARVADVDRDAGCLWARTEVVVEPDEEGPEREALMRTVRGRFYSYMHLQPSLPEGVGQLVTQAATASVLADTVAAYAALPYADKQCLLEMVDPEARLRTLADILENELALLEIQKKIGHRVRARMNKSQKEYFLKEQLKAIEEELGYHESGEGLAELREQIAASGMPDAVRKVALREHHRLSRMLPLTPQAVVVGEYLDWLIHMPWQKRTDDRLDLRHVRRVLDEDHFGLEEPKERILEYLAVKKLAADHMQEPILCFVGPPGVGKTSLAGSVARALGRRFVRKSLGGVRDEAEIRGHRRTYVGALPGRILQSIRKAGVRNPVFLLDEIDKMGQGMAGDPASALLEVLDPDENHAFSDHYLEVEFDLSDVLFICTANVATNIPPVLMDRLEVIELSGYTLEEKIGIAEHHLLPRERAAHGLGDGEVTIPREVLLALAERYTREAGVRNLRKRLARVLRKIAVQRASADTPAPEPHAVTVDHLRTYLGPAPYRRGQTGPKEGVGTVTSLARTEVGGRSLTIECSCMAGKGELTLTGQLGEVMQESVKTALSWVRSRCSRPGVVPARHAVDLHVHVPEGATPKDGPSAGLPVLCALASAMSGCPARRDVAMTGEVTLQGRVLAVGGIKEKVLAAHREGLTRLVLPAENRDDLEKVPADVREELDIRFVNRVEECLREIVPGLKGQFRSRAPSHARREG